MITQLAEEGVIDRYAIAGAIAALNYIQPALTEDLDILISVAHFGKGPAGLILLTPIEEALAKMGYRERTGVGYMIEGWPVQFLPVASPLEEEALERSVELDIDMTGQPPLRARSLTAEYLAAIAVKVGRLKDLARVQAFLDEQALDLNALKAILVRHNLIESWRSFCTRAAIADPLNAT